MAVVSHEQPRAHEARRWRDFPVSEVAASITISVIWLTVLLTALFGPDIVSTSAGGSNSVVPSAIVVGFFALIATWIVARYGFRRDPEVER